MTPHREILRKADEVVERARASGRVDRRAFLQFQEKIRRINKM